jgi:phage terminase large subunit-like protein
MAKSRQRTSSATTGSTGKRDYVAIAVAYAREAIADKRGKKHGKRIRQAAQRFLADLKRAQGKRPPFVFDDDPAFDACDFIEKLPHVEGVWDSPNIVLHPSHMFFVVQLFGFRKPDGTRRFTSALFAVARKNAKSTLAAAILLYCLCCEDEPGAQLISAATTGSQARIIFNVAKRMAEKKASLRDAFGIECWANAVTRVEIGASFKPINAKASTQDGLNPSITALDEIHAHKNGDLLNVLQSAAGARSSPLWLFTTTEGYESPGPWSEIRHFAKQVLDGVLGVTADHFLVLFFAVDEEDEDFSEAAWIKANPLADCNPHLLAAIRKEAIEARAMPGKLAEFRIKRLNRQSSSAKALIDVAKWNRCGGVIDLDWLAQFPCWAAFDLSSTTDLTAWRLVWRVDGRWYTWGRRWVPADAVAHRTQRGANAYAGWIASGDLLQTEGDSVDYAVIEQAIREDVARFNPQAIAFDEWNAKDIANRLLQDQLPLVRFIQGGKSYHPAMQEVDRAYRRGELVHGGDPVLRWCASNVVPRYDANLNMAPDKRRSPEKIDDMAALYMAIGVALVQTDDGDMSGFLANPVRA